jgi:hypothetical protein
MARKLLLSIAPEIRFGAAATRIDGRHITTAAKLRKHILFSEQTGKKMITVNEITNP